MNSQQMPRFSQSPRSTQVFRSLLLSSALVALFGSAAGCADAPRAASSQATAQEFKNDNAVAQITSVLAAYQTALNQAAVEDILALYAEDAVFMAQHRAPAQGKAEIERAYREIFGAISLQINFEIDEIVPVSPTLAYARTRSIGNLTIKAAQQTRPEGNQELFVFERADASSPWQIGRYIFSTTNAPAIAAAPAKAEYVPVLESVKSGAIAVDRSIGYATLEVKKDVFVITDGTWQSAFIKTGKGVVVLDAPESYAAKIPAAIAQVTDEPIVMLVYTHAHKDHIGGSAAFAKIPGLKIVALHSVQEFLQEKQDPNRLVPTQTFADHKTLKIGDKKIELRRTRNFHSDEGDLMVYLPESKFLMAIDTLAPGYVPFMGFDLTSNFHEYLKVFDDILKLDFDVFVGGHLTQLGTRRDVELTRDYVRDVYQTVKRVHNRTDMMQVMGKAAQEVGGWDNQYLLFRKFLDQVTQESMQELQSRWIGKLAGVDVFLESHVATALVYVRWDD